MNQNIELNDDIDLKELFITLWRGKIYIILMSLFSVFLASVYLQTTEKKFSVEYNLKPVAEESNGSALSGLGGLASITGIQLPSASNNDFKIFKELLTSLETSEIIFRNKKIVKDVFKSEWDASLNDFSRPAKSTIHTAISNFKKLLIENKEVSYMPPNPRRLAIFIFNNVQINENTETGFLKLKSETSNPELILSLINEATIVSDKIMRQRYIDFSTEPLSFYKEKLRTARSREHREALAELIGKEEKKLMFASVGKYFVAEPYLKPTISLYPTAPNPKSVLFLSLVLGLFFGSAVILIRNAIARDKY